MASNDSAHSLIDEQDWLLETAVNIANQVDGFGMSITLVTRGAVITGTLIGAKEYYEKYGAQWRQSLGDGEAGRTVEQRWVKVGEDAFAEYTKAGDGAESALPRPQYIHVKDARIVFGQALVPTPQAFLWRGRIAEVVGFSIGALGTDGSRK